MEYVNIEQVNELTYAGLQLASLRQFGGTCAQIADNLLALLGSEVDKLTRNVYQHQRAKAAQLEPECEAISVNAECAEEVLALLPSVGLVDEPVFKSSNKLSTTPDIYNYVDFMACKPSYKRSLQFLLDVLADGEEYTSLQLHDITGDVPNTIAGRMNELVKVGFLAHGPNSNGRRHTWVRAWSDEIATRVSFAEAC